ncbi:MAG: cell division protein FtsQ/DivIB [Bacteroidales bacterium]|nr:cell division protein FtsQ/DivIB [Bacteroidales bacterium]
MKPFWRKGLGLLTVLACCAVWILTSGMGVRQRRTRTCQSGINVTVLDSAERRFVSRDDIQAWLDRDYHAYVGLPLDSVNLDRIERLVCSRSAVKSCEAWMSDDGKLNIEINQREPVIRFQDSGNGWYADADGFIFPLQARGSVCVPVVDGNLPLTVPRGFKGMPEAGAGREWLLDMVALVNYIHGSVWEQEISQIHVSPEGNLILYTVSGREKFIFGRPEGFTRKFRLLRSYYEAVLPEKGAGYYSTVDLRYRNQLVCRQ